MSAALAPLPPFDTWPVQLVFGGRDGLLWLADDGTICVQILCERGDLGMAKRYVGAIRAIRALRPYVIARGGGVRMLQDFHRIRTVEKGVREYLSDAAARDFAPGEPVFNKVRIAEELVLVRIALYLHAVTIARFGQSRFESVRDLGAELRKLGLVAPSIDDDIENFRRDFADACARLQDP